MRESTIVRRIRIAVKKQYPLAWIVKEAKS